ncbi:Rne/Rng family ribonuclease [Pseudomonadota bacterium]|nr:Rne/Rng family ribonuclease [Pseudomonadota bacterium]
MKRILINSSYNDELRVALVDGAKLFDLDTEVTDRVLYKGSIFKATVSRIEQSLNAAFVDFGSTRHGFLPLKELSRNFYKKNSQGKSECSLREGQEILVQINKEERGTKGATLSTQISIAGRFMVLIANSDKSGGISRRITGDEREDLKNQISKLDIPEGMSVIIRTAGIDRSFEELQNDLNYLISLWDDINATQASADSPQLIYKDDKLIVRVFRDIFRDDIEEILVDDKSVFEEAKNFAELVIPDQKDKVKLYDEEIPLFNRYQIESQIELAFQREISLPSGGSIVIDPTEAMTTIDINSARSTKGKDIEETALKTNLEAAKEIARQLRLRDVGGLIVIDFIDMQNEDSQNKVENAFRRAVSSDRARIQIASISRFGLLEISRQRLKPSLNETYDIEHVLVRGPRSIGQSILRIIGEDVAKDNTAEIQVYVPADVASYLLNEKRRDILSIEDSTGVKILIIADPYKSRPYYKVVRIKDSEVKKKSSYDLTPDSPKPDTDWRDEKSGSKLNPLVDATDHKKNHKSGGGILSWIKSLTASPQPKKTSKKKSTQKRRPRKGNYKKKNANSSKSRPSRKPSSSKNTRRASTSKSTRRPSKSIDRKPKNDSRTKDMRKKAPSRKPRVEKDTSKKISGRQDIVRETKKKPEPPTRALNDPRDN